MVLRSKKNLQCKIIKWKRRLPKNVLSDVTIDLIGFYPRQYYPDQLRLIKYWDDEQQRDVESRSIGTSCESEVKQSGVSALSLFTFSPEFIEGSLCFSGPKV